MDSLVDAVWDTSPPSTARSQVQFCVSGLRRLFRDAGQPDAIKTRAPGYLLELAGGTLDSDEFAGLVTSARAHVDAGNRTKAAATLRSALALWRGSALSDIDSEPVRRGAMLLEERRLSALEERIRLDIELGRHEDISGELAALIEEHPLRERFYEFCMLALYRCGRQGEALEVCRRARATLVDQLGIEPGQELHRLEAAILNRAPALDLPADGAGSFASGAPVSRAAAGPAVAGAPEPSATPRRLPASIADFTGRQEYIDEITRLLTAEPEDNGAPYGMRIVGISGRGGVGKSSLAIRAAHQLSETFPDGHLYADLHGVEGADRTATLLARFLRALGVQGSAIPDDTEERAEMYRSRLAGKRLLVVLDDVTSEEQVLPLLPGSPTCAVVVTSRVRLYSLLGAHWISVEVLDVDQSLELLDKIVGAGRIEAERELSTELVELCGRLPLALRIAGARLASRPHWRIAGLVRRLRNETRRLDELSYHGLALRSNIGLTYRSLSEQARRLFRLFSLLQGPDFPVWTAAALLDVDLYHAEDVLESLIDAQVLDTIEYPGERLRYRFHDLVRVYARERLAETESDAERTEALARVLGAWLALAERAHRKEYGGDYEILHGTAPRWWPAGDDTDPVHHPVEWWESERRAVVAAIRQAAETGLSEHCWDLALTAIGYFEVKGYFDDWAETSHAALAAAERDGNDTGRAAMLFSLGALHMSQRRLAEAESNFAEALDLFGPAGNTRGCALVLRDWMSLDRMRGRTEAMMRRYEQALERMRAVGDLLGEAHLRRGMAKFWIDEGDLDTARRLLDRALDLCRQVRYVRGEAQVLNWFAELHMRSGQIEEARQGLHRVLLIVRDIGDRTGEVYALYGLGIVRYREGRLDNAETTLIHALSVARQVGERVVEGKALYALGEMDLIRGRTAGAAVYLTDAELLFGELDVALWHARTLLLLAEVYQNEGDADLVRQHVDRAVELLSGLESREAARLLDSARSARPADDRC